MLFYLHVFTKHIAVLLSFFQLMLDKLPLVCLWEKNSYVSSSPNSVQLQMQNYTLWHREVLLWLLIKKSICLHSPYVVQPSMKTQYCALLPTYGFISCSCCQSDRINIKLSNHKTSSEAVNDELCCALIAVRPPDLMKYEFHFPFSRPPLFSTSLRGVSQGAADKMNSGIFPQEAKNDISPSQCSVL